MAWIGSSPTGEGTARVGAWALPWSRRGALAVQVGLLVGAGLVAAVLQSFLKLRLGIPGHSSLLWLVPLVAARCLVPLTPAGGISSTSMAMGLYAFGGFSLRWPLALSFGSYLLVGPALDLCWVGFDRLFGESDRAGSGLHGYLAWVLVPLAGVIGNYAHLLSKLALGIIRPHGVLLGMRGGVLEFVTYLVFGLASGFLALGIVWRFLKPRRRGETTGSA